MFKIILDIDIEISAIGNREYKQTLQINTDIIILTTH